MIHILINIIISRIIAVLVIKQEFAIFRFHMFAFCLYTAILCVVYTLQVGPENPFKTNQQKAKKNTLTGFVEPSHISEFQFETQRRTFNSYGSISWKDSQFSFVLAGCLLCVIF